MQAVKWVEHVAFDRYSGELNFKLLATRKFHWEKQTNSSFENIDKYLFCDAM